MNKKQIRAELAKLKIQYGDGRIPTVAEIKICVENISLIETIVTLSSKKYLTYMPPEYIEDDEGIKHRFERGYKLTQKARDLLEEV
jgi:hypothetical protein